MFPSNTCTVHVSVLYMLWFNLVFALNFFSNQFNFSNWIFLNQLSKKGFFFFFGGGGVVVKITGARGLVFFRGSEKKLNTCNYLFLRSTHLPLPDLHQGPLVRKPINLIQD